MLRLHVVQLLVNKYDLAMVVFTLPTSSPCTAAFLSRPTTLCPAALQGTRPSWFCAVGKKMFLIANNIKQLTKWNQIYVDKYPVATSSLRSAFLFLKK